MVGGDYTVRNYHAAAEEGRIVQIATLAGTKAEIDLWPLIRKRLIHTGSTLRPRSAAFKGEIAAALKDKVWPLLESGAIRAVIDATFPLRQAVEAHRRIELPGHIGKIVLEVASL